MSLLPQDIEDREKLAQEIERAVNLLEAIEGLKDDIKEIAERVELKLQVKKTAFSKLAKAKHKEDAAANRMEAEEIEESLDILFAD